MDLTELQILLPSGGVLIVLAWLIVHLMRQASGDRGDYQEQLRAIRAQHVVEIQELTARHDAQISDLRTQLDTVRVELSDLRNQMEQERRARWHAEDTAAKWRRMIEVEKSDGSPVDDDS